MRTIVTTALAGLLALVVSGVVRGDDKDVRAIIDKALKASGGAENIAKYFFDRIASQLLELTGGRVRVRDCVIWETDTSFARYYE